MTKVDISLLIPCRKSSHSLENTVSQTYDFFSRYKKDTGDSFEIILIPNGTQTEKITDPTFEVARKVAERIPEVKCIPHTGQAGKGAALKTGFIHAEGKWILFTDADLPYDLDFFSLAIPKLKSGYGFVTGNRRLPESHFDIPVALLPLAYGRHRLGVWFNRWVRLLLPIYTTDTQAGIKAMSRELANKAFAWSKCPFFLFDLEFFLMATGNGFRHCELPVTLFLNTEKTTVRVIKESLSAIYWLTKIKVASLLGHYGHTRKPNKSIISYYKNAGFFTKLFLKIRWALTPYSKMEKHVPEVGAILDLGCGHGLLSLLMASESREREVLGVDHDDGRIDLANSAKDRMDKGRTTFKKGDFTIPTHSTSYSGVTLIDVMHYFPFETQVKTLRSAFTALKPEGKLILREVDTQGGVMSHFNKFYEKIATGVGFTQSKESSLFFRTRYEWEALLRELGFFVRSERCSHFLFSDVLFIAEKPS
jgi:2-polyprenyl-6-hydroxyphenyl methylase/3-demethylubiquinone-9 3-methyltransferase